MNANEMEMLQAVLDPSERGPGMDQKRDLLRTLRAVSPQMNDEIDKHMLLQQRHMAKSVQKAGAHHAELEQLVGRLKAPPWVPAVVLGRVCHNNSNGNGNGNGKAKGSGKAKNNGGDKAEGNRHFRLLVQHENHRRIVDALGDVATDTLEPGDEVYLSGDAAVIVAVAAGGPPGFGDTAVFDRYLPDGRAVVRYRDEQMISRLAGRLKDQTLQNGDLVHWDRDIRIVFEKIDRASGEHMFLEETPPDTFDQIGGLDDEIADITEWISLQVLYPELVKKYGVARMGSVMLVGPPGNGKTKFARALANWLAELTGAGRSFMINVKPGAMRNMWYGQTEQNYRDLFKAAKDASHRNPDTPVVIFFDEVDSISGVRGGGGVEDRVMPALMAEIDGFANRGRVWLVSATNRMDSVDPAMLRQGRLGDKIVRVPRPGLEAARQIFGKYLDHNLPCARNGHGDDLDATRLEIIDATVSSLYSPNAGGRLATLQFRDGTERHVTPADLVSGAMIAGAVADAARRAARREAKNGREGVELADLTEAMARQLESAAAALTPTNCRFHLTDLPDDAHVMAVRPVRRQVRNAYDYLAPL